MIRNPRPGDLPAPLLRRLARLRLDAPAARHAAVIGVATTWLLLTLLPHRPDAQWVYVTAPGAAEPRVVSVPADGPQARRLTQLASRLAEPAAVHRSVAYCQARWRFEAASHYIQQLSLAAGGAGGVRTADAEGQGYGAVTPVSFEATASGAAAASKTTYGIAYWQAHRDAAAMQMQQLVAASASASPSPWTIRIGERRAGGPYPAAALAALAAGCASAWLFVWRRDRPARLLCQARCQVVVPAAWVRCRPPAAQWLRRAAYRSAWVAIVICGALRWL